MLFAVESNFFITAVFVFLGIFFDFFDGFLARKLRVQSALGIELDSLADLVTSGVVPGMVMYKLIDESIGGAHSIFVIDNIGLYKTIETSNGHLRLLALFGFLITMASAYRLAKFNIDTEQQSFFKGLPVPANTLLILSFPLILEFQYSITIANLLSNTWFLVVLCVISSYLLVSRVKLFALKFSTWHLKGNKLRYGFLILSVLMLIVLKFVAIPLIIILYILLSVYNQSTISKEY